MGRKIDAEPGRCRRTDGTVKDMHRSKNRSSRKPLPPPQFSVPSTPSIFLAFFSLLPGLDTNTPLVKSKRSCSGLAMEADDGSSKYESLKQREKQPDRSCFILGTELGTLERPLMLEEKQKQRDDKDYEEDEQQSKRFYKFLDEWPSSKSSGSTSLFI
ncbi:hypothetical protein Bca101_075297 [Brassica carinata]